MIRSDQIAKQYGCPKEIAVSMRLTPELPIFVAVLRLGPIRVQWVGNPASRRDGYREHTTCWSLNGKEATYEEMRVAAKLPPTFLGPENKYHAPYNNLTPA